jgi:hypothetical protein
MTSLLHFTHVSNIEPVMTQGLLCDRRMIAAGLDFVEAGSRDIKGNRRRLSVTAGPGGCPADYVPFYFAPRSPMMYTISRGSVAHYQEGLEPLVYLVTTIERVRERNLPFAFLDGNCGSAITAYSDDLAELDEYVDWPLMRATMWNNTPEDLDRMRRRMAEFLVHESVPWEVFIEIVVMTERVADQVRVIGERLGLVADIRVERGWYYP